VKLSDCLGCLFDLLLRITGLGPGNRDEPVKIRVPEFQCLPAAGAGPAGLAPGALAEEQLREPERQSLLSDSDRSRQDHDLRKTSSREGCGEATPSLVVTGDRSQRHASEDRRRDEEWVPNAV
jgi:hypothetical protein